MDEAIKSATQFVMIKQALDSGCVLVYRNGDIRINKTSISNRYQMSVRTGDKFDVGSPIELSEVISVMSVLLKKDIHQ